MTNDHIRKAAFALSAQDRLLLALTLLESVEKDLAAMPDTDPRKEPLEKRLAACEDSLELHDPEAIRDIAISSQEAREGKTRDAGELLTELQREVKGAS
jgi:hypothetical protein